MGRVFSRLWIATLLAIGVPSLVYAQGDPLTPWRNGVTVRDAVGKPARHTIHSYYVCNPESPEGKQILFFASTAANGYSGEVCIVDRATGVETVLARDIHTEDAHRVACQQWCSGGRRVAFHDVIDGRWNVSVVDVSTGQRRTLIHDR
ncbi:MAG: hypothetical protein JNM18_08550, partial [Planctomycetaceae bacterium]|nr:hypothetical protein [Planctomycetaceae bacterium]